MNNKNNNINNIIVEEKEVASITDGINQAIELFLNEKK